MLRIKVIAEPSKRYKFVSLIKDLSSMKQALKIAVATLALASFAATAQAEGDAKKGEKVLKKC
jgi:hypothetical protein